MKSDEVDRAYTTSSTKLNNFNLSKGIYGFNRQQEADKYADTKNAEEVKAQMDTFDAQKLLKNALEENEKFKSGLTDEQKKYLVYNPNGTINEDATTKAMEAANVEYSIKMLQRSIAEASKQEEWDNTYKVLKKEYDEETKKRPLSYPGRDHQLIRETPEEKLKRLKDAWYSKREPEPVKPDTFDSTKMKDLLLNAQYLQQYGVSDSESYQRLIDKARANGIPDAVIAATYGASGNPNLFNSSSTPKGNDIQIAKNEEAKQEVAEAIVKDESKSNILKAIGEGLNENKFSMNNTSKGEIEKVLSSMYTATYKDSEGNTYKIPLRAEDLKNIARLTNPKNRESYFLPWNWFSYIEDDIQRGVDSYFGNMPKETIQRMANDQDVWASSMYRLKGGSK